ncbi:MAG TPA: SDR family NAD(P)-dependent oxidoreductase [Solirubrobacterales bacterium]|nr:SDR family NAD(P)-dependent oxidoreductase [Solirubrobacterales bacterium]
MSGGDFTGKAALISGGARGLGAACALALAERGADVALLDAPGKLETPSYPLASKDDLEATAAAVRASGRECLTLACDVRSHEAVAAAVERAAEHFGRLDIAVSAAGIRTPVAAAEMSDAQWFETVDTNLNGAYHVLREAVPRMIAAGGGRVLVVAGDEGRRGAPGLSHTAAAAWGAIGLAKSVAIETADAGVAVNVLCTTPLDTAMFATPESWAQAAREEGAGAEEAAHALRVRHPLSEAFVPLERVVETALFLLGQPGAELTGSVVDVSNGLSALNSA